MDLRKYVNRRNLYQLHNLGCFNFRLIPGIVMIDYQNFQKKSLYNGIFRGNSSLSAVNYGN